MMPRAAPWAPVFRPAARHGQINVGAQVGTPPLVPSLISHINTVSLQDEPWGIAVAGTYAIVSCGGASDRVMVLDLVDPTTPAVVGTVINSSALNGPRDVAIYGSDRAVVGAATSGRAVLVSFSTPSSPSIPDSEIGFTGPLGMGVAGDHAIMADQDGDLIVSLDLSVANTITTNDTLADANIADPSSVSVEGTIAAVPNESSSTPRLNLIDVSDPSNLTIAGGVSDADLDSGFDVRLRDGIAWVVAYGGSSALTVVDCSVPATPSVIGTLTGSGIALPIAVELYVNAAGSFPLVADLTNDTVSLIDGRDPTSPVVLDDTGVGAAATIRRMAVYQNYVYVLEAVGDSLRVLEIT